MLGVQGGGATHQIGGAAQWCIAQEIIHPPEPVKLLNCFVN